MKKVSIDAFDDQEWAERRQLIPADGTHVLVLDVAERELDLTDEHFTELKNLLAKYFAMGSKPSTRPKHGKHRTPDPVKVAYQAKLREWAKEQGREAEYKPKDGGYYYPVPLKRDYEKAMALQAGLSGSQVL